MAASTPVISNTNNTTTSTPATQAGSNGPAAGQKVNASEVGWLFVHEYYTFLNKEPSRLHCFYGQKSTLIHGTEGETVTPSQGEKEIKEKFQGLNLENCRVLVTNVDSQASNNGGILIQVLGEMSNRNEVARRFAQTFFLDVQPNGYYVLNDIIRFLSDDDVEIYSGEEEVGASTSPTGTLVEEPINVPSPRVEQAGPSNSVQNTTITESTQVTSRTMDANITLLSSKENEPHLQAALNGEVVEPIVDNSRLHTRPPPAPASIIHNTNLQPSTIVQPVQSRSPLPPTMQNNNGQQMVNVKKQEPSTTLAGSASQEGHVNGQALPMQSIETYPKSTPVFSTNIQQPPAIVTEQEPANIPTNIESNSLQTLTSSILTTPPVEQDKNGRQPAIISKQVSAQSPTINASHEVSQVPSAQINIVPFTIGTQSPPVTQYKTGQPVQCPVVNTTLQSQANSQSPISATNFNVQVSSNIPKSHPVPNNSIQAQAANTSQAQTKENDQSPKSATDNNIQLSSSKQKSSFAAQDNNNGQAANVTKQAPMTAQSESPSSISVHSQSVVNNKGQSTNAANAKQQVNMNNVQNIPKNDITTDNSHTQQPQPQASTKKTWATLAANEPEKWSSNALAETKGVVASVPAKPLLQVQSQQMRDNRDRRPEGQKNNGRRNSDTSLSIYVKGVTHSMSYEQLKAAFMAFGHVKHLDVVHAKSCAFVEYTNAESYRRALEVRTVDIGNETVNTEERRPTRRNNGKASRGRYTPEVVGGREKY